MGAAQKHLMATWLQAILRAVEDLHLALVAALERRIIRLEARNEAFIGRKHHSNLDAWIARRAQDDLIAALEDRFALGTAHPKIEADTIGLLFTARDVAPARTKVLGHVRVLEEALAQKPGLKTVMVDAGRPAADAVRSRLKSAWASRR